MLVACRVGNGAGIPRTRRGPAWEKFPGLVGEQGGVIPYPGTGENSSPSPSPFSHRVKFSVFFPFSRPAVIVKLQIYPSFTNLVFIILKGI